MNAIEKRFNTMLNFCYLIAMEKDTKKQREHIDQMARYVRGEK